MSSGEPKPVADPIAEAIEAMNRAAEALAKTVAGAGSAQSDQQPELPAGSADATPLHDAMPSQEEAEEARRFYRHLEERGQLVDVRDSSEIATLPPNVTHVRYPDGRIERIGFS
jgi:hypothetical protein